MSRRGAAVDSDYDDDDDEEEEQEDPISFDDRCKLVHVKSLALQSLAAVHPLLNTKTKKEHLAIITDCANDIADHLEQLQPPPPSKPIKRGREDDDDDDDEERFFSLSERAEHLGINLSDAQKKEAGLKVHIAYKDRYGRNPAKGGMAGGIKVNQYSEHACERVMDPILKTY